MIVGWKRSLSVISLSLAAVLILAGLAIYWIDDGGRGVYEPAGSFTATDFTGSEFSLSDSEGKVTVIHFTQLENPLCIECEDSIRGQIEELETLASANDGSFEIITINIRKNAYSEDGWAMAQEWYGTDITWHWVEEYDPFPVSGSYVQFWQLDGAFSNPSIVLIDHELMVVGNYHVYCIGKGVVDGVQGADSLKEDIDSIAAGTWSADEDGGALWGGASVGGMFLLGIVTSFSPCSIAFLMAVISFVGAASLHRKEGDSDGPVLGVGLRIGVAFTVGTGAVFLMFGLLISYIGDFVEMSSVFFLIAGIILVILGLNTILPISTLLRQGLSALGAPDARGDSCRAPKMGGMVGRIRALGERSPELAGVLLGALFSIGWAPCALSLTLPVMILLVTQDISVLSAGILMLSFGLGHGAAILPFCVATGEIRGAVGDRYVALATWVQRAFAVAVICLGVLFMARFVGFNLW